MKLNYVGFKEYFLNKKGFKKFRKWYCIKFKFKCLVGYFEFGFIIFG